MKVLSVLVVGALPTFAFAAAPTSSLDIGATQVGGSTSSSNGVYAVRASGADVWDTQDEFRFVYTSLAGDAEITARVDNLAAPHDWTKAGVMIRETLSPSSRFAYALLSGANGALFQYRANPGGLAAAAGAADGIARAPYWVRLRRDDNVFTAYVSQNGTEWLQRGRSVTIPMSASTYAGLALTSHRDGVLATAGFSHVAIAGLEPQIGTRGVATLTWTAPTEHTDGAPLTDLVGFRLYWGPAPGLHSRQLVINNPGIKTWRVGDLPPGPWYFAVSAISVSGLESAKSNEIHKLIL
jgi:hypothetical protein